MMRVEFPLGEVFTLAPLVSLGIIPEPVVDPAGIGDRESWCAHGLEGKGYVIVNDAMADLLHKRLGKYRSRMVPMSPDPVPIDVLPTPQRLR